MNSPRQMVTGLGLGLGLVGLERNIYLMTVVKSSKKEILSTT
jgi:hypothetical protein